MSWIQNICMRCWVATRGATTPIVCKTSEVEQCCHCGAYNTDGIYVRENPRTVPFPYKEKP